jgi:hypothetical protein
VATAKILAVKVGTSIDLSCRPYQPACPVLVLQFVPVTIVLVEVDF